MLNATLMILEFLCQSAAFFDNQARLDQLLKEHRRSNILQCELLERATYVQKELARAKVFSLN